METQFTSPSAQTIDQLKERYDAGLNEKKIEAQTNLQHAQERAGTATSQGQERVRTDNLEELKAKLEEMKRSNEEARSTYQNNLLDRSSPSWRRSTRHTTRPDRGPGTLAFSQEAQEGHQDDRSE